MADLPTIEEAILLASRPALAGGHRWMRCSSCGGWAMALEAGGRCRQGTAIAKWTNPGGGKRPTVTYSCPGRLEVPVAAARGGDEVCARGGCRNAATLPTWSGERLCRRCFWVLAAALASYP